MYKKSFATIMLVLVLFFANSAMVNANTRFTEISNNEDYASGPEHIGRLVTYSDYENGVSLLWPVGWYGPYCTDENYLDVWTKLNEDTFIRIFSAPIDQDYPTLEDFRKATRARRETTNRAEDDYYDIGDEMVKLNGMDFVKWTLESKEEQGDKAYDAVYTTYANGHIYEVEFCFMSGKE